MNLKLELAFKTETVKLHIKFYILNIDHILCIYLPPNNNKNTHKKIRTKTTISLYLPSYLMSKVSKREKKNL